MEIKDVIKKLFRSVGYEMRKYAPDRSDNARLAHLFQFHQIDLVLDVGANTGQYAASIRCIGYKGRIVSFEPLRRAHAQLLSASEHDRLWTVAPRAAIGDRDGEISINVSRNSVSSSILPILDSHKSQVPDSAYSGAEVVPIYKLDTIAPNYINAETKSVYLKIDVQGFEKNVLDGAAQIVQRAKGLQLELSLVPLYEGELLFTDMLQKMDGLGYDLYAVIPGFSDMVSGRLLQLDGIFFRKGLDCCKGDQ